MPISAFVGIVVGVAAVSVGVYHAAVVGPRFRELTRVLAGEGLEESESIAIVRAAQAAFARRAEERLDVLEQLTAKEMLRIGFVRYNSFSDVGSDQSFTLALLNRDGDGVVLTSIFGREETRTYGKSVRGFVPQQGVSKEEQSAITMARERESTLSLT